MNINSGARVELLGNISANTINLGCELDLQKTGGNIIVGEIFGNGSGNLNLNEATNILNGDLSLISGDIITTNISNSNDAGAITINGAAATNSNSSLHVNLGSNETRVGSRYILISSSDGSALNKMSVNVDNSGSSRSGIYVFSTQLSENNLVLEVNRYMVSSLFSSVNSSAYNAIVDVESPSGSLLTLQQYLDSDSNSEAQKMTALNSANSQLDNSHNRMIFNNSDLAANLISSRLETVRSSGKSSGDEELSKAIWMEVFGANVNQGNSGGYEGYKAGSSGFSFGADKDFDNDLTLGIAAIYAHSNIKSTSGNKRTGIDNYQINFYAKFTLYCRKKFH